MKDTIYRQDAIDAFIKWFFDVFGIGRSDRMTTLLERLKEIPSARPEIIRCKNCKDYQEGVDINGKPFSRCNGSVRTYGHTMPDWYCADAERREE